MIGPLVAFDRLPVVLVIVGGCIALVSFLGCCGACEDSVCFLCVVRIQSFLSPTHSLTALPLSLSPRGSSRSKYLQGPGPSQGRLNQWAHWARAQGPRIFVFLRGPQLAVVK